MCHCAFNRMCDRNTPKHPLRSFTTTHKMSKLRFFFHVHAKLCNCTCTLNFSYISPVWALSRSKNTLEDTFQGKWNYVQGIVILHLYNYRMWLKSSLASHIVVPWTENITTWRMPSFWFSASTGECCCIVTATFYSSNSFTHWGGYSRSNEIPCNCCSEELNKQLFQQWTTAPFTTWVVLSPEDKVDWWQLWLPWWISASDDLFPILQSARFLSGIRSRGTILKAWASRHVCNVLHTHHAA